MQTKFKDDLIEVYELITARAKALGAYFEILEDENSYADMREFIDTFLAQIGLVVNKENRLCALSRLISLRDEQLVTALEKENFEPKEIEAVREIAYEWVREFYLVRHKELLDTIEQRNLLNAFYRALLEGVHEVGVAMSFWQSTWNEHIINTINPQLQREYGDGVIEYLGANELFDRNAEGRINDRSYSVLQKTADGYKALAYSLFFKDEVAGVVQHLQALVQKLKTLEDPDTNQKEAYITYFEKLITAFSQTDREQLLDCWSDVDRAWMCVNSPLQVGHPLEYYEDHYRKAVALEWDVRIVNPKATNAAQTEANIRCMYENLFSKIGKNKEHILTLTLAALDRVGLYIGRPMTYYGAEFNGLFSAQVVPNDEAVTKEAGKKIFAFSDNVLDSLRAKPFLKIQNQIFGKAFMDKERELVFKKPELWHRVYEVTTIGHEYGHILWLDHDSESQMNRTGVFKNIEEFKATCGGLMAFFANEGTELGEYVLRDTIKRAVGLIAWMKTGEVEPYYCEGLIHLHGLFDTGVLSFDTKLEIDTSRRAYERLKSWYIDTYTALASHYLSKKDANIFLSQYAQKDGGVYKPVDTQVRAFVEYYWNLHQAIGREIDAENRRADWL